ncbi:MAG: MerR family transcriptional regulator [Actinobacteria bacterium]|nr:MerR family transcriptional regulator [Actinomycetota bacterium]
MTRRDRSEQANYVISVAAELAGMHPQTLRVYERKGLLNPQRTEGNSRRYSDTDIQLLKKIQQLTAEGINLAGVTRILELERRMRQLQARHERTLEELNELHEELASVIHGRSDFPLVPFREIRRVRRVLKSDAIDRATRRRVFAVPPSDSEQPRT